MKPCSETRNWIFGGAELSKIASTIAPHSPGVFQGTSKIRFFCPLEPPEIFERVLAGLNWQEGIHSPPSWDKRQAFRHACFLPALLVTCIDAKHVDTDFIAFPGQCRNLSRNGASLLVSKFVVPPSPEGCRRHDQSQTLLINLEQVLSLGLPCTLGVKGEGGRPLWLTSEVVRKRVLGAKIVELGLKFLSKLEYPAFLLTSREDNPLIKSDPN